MAVALLEGKLLTPNVTVTVATKRRPEAPVPAAPKILSSEARCCDISPAMSLDLVGSWPTTGLGSRPTPSVTLSRTEILDMQAVVAGTVAGTA